MREPAQDLNSCRAFGWFAARRYTLRSAPSRKRPRPGSELSDRCFSGSPRPGLGGSTWPLARQARAARDACNERSGEPRSLRDELPGPRGAVAHCLPGLHWRREQDGTLEASAGRSVADLQANPRERTIVLGRHRGRAMVVLRRVPSSVRAWGCCPRRAKARSRDRRGSGDRSAQLWSLLAECGGDRQRIVPSPEMFGVSGSLPR